MFKTNLIDVIKTFSKDEVKRFVDFVNSPYHNSNKSVIKLAELLKKYYPEFDNRNFTREKIYSKLYPGSVYNDQVLRNIMSDALQLCFEFLILETAKRNTAERSIYLLKELRTRKLDPIYDKMMKNSYKALESEHVVNFGYFENLYRLESEVFLNELIHNRQEAVYPVVQRQSELLTYDYIAKLINHIIDMNVNEKYYSTSGNTFVKDIYSNIDIRGILERLKNTSEIEYRVLSLFYSRAKLALNGTDEDYYGFREQFFGSINLLNSSTAFIFLATLETYIIGCIKSDPGKYRKELHFIHKKSIEHGLLKLYEEDYLNLVKYWNVFINSIEINDTDFAEEFAGNYCSTLEPEVKEGAYNLSKAIIAYKRRNYDEALNLLNKTKLSQYLFKLTIKTFYLRIYFEKGDFQSAGFALDSYKQFLYKNKTISETYRNTYLNFASMYNELIKVSLGEKTGTKEELTEKIESFRSNIYNRQWLLDMINKL